MKKYEQELITLDSGLRILLTKTPDNYTSHLEVTFLVGAENETDHKGISHLLEHSTFLGTDKYTKGELGIEFEKISANFNAATDLLRTYYFCSVPKTKLKRAIELWSEMIFKSNIDERLLEYEKNRVAEEIYQGNDKSSTFVNSKMSELLYEGTGLANTTLGTVESVKNISRQDLLEFRDKHYNSKNCIVSVVGDFTAEEVKNMVEEYIEPKISKNGVESGFTKKVKTNKGKRADLYKNDNQVSGQISFKIPGYNESDNKKIRLINSILGSGIKSRLNENIDRQLGLYHIYSEVFDLVNNSTLDINFKTSKDKLDAVIKEIKKVVEDVCQNGVTQEEFDNAKSKAIDSCYMNQDYPSSRIGYYIVEGKLYNPQQKVDEIVSLQKSDCERAFRKHIDTNNAYEVYVGPHAEQKATKEDSQAEIELT